MNKKNKMLMEREVYKEMELTSEMVKSIRCLCPVCLSHFMETRAFQIMRIPSVDGSKDTCTICQTRLGFDYVVMPDQDC